MARCTALHVKGTPRLENDGVMQAMLLGKAEAGSAGVVERSKGRVVLGGAQEESRTIHAQAS